MLFSELVVWEEIFSLGRDMMPHYLKNCVFWVWVFLVVVVVEKPRKKFTTPLYPKKNHPLGPAQNLELLKMKKHPLQPRNNLLQNPDLKIGRLDRLMK
jgi:hypothetical protein